jgi:hypothetical protein
MTEIDDLSARVAALETVLRQLMTHLAVHSEDPPGWVATRRVLALHAARDQLLAPGDRQASTARAGLESAISGFFAPVEGVLREYPAATPDPVRQGSR